jgi:hypothetical protein
MLEYRQNWSWLSKGIFKQSWIKNNETIRLRNRSSLRIFLYSNEKRTREAKDKRHFISSHEIYVKEIDECFENLFCIPRISCPTEFNETRVTVKY